MPQKSCQENRIGESDKDLATEMCIMTETVQKLIGSATALYFFKHIVGKTFGCGTGRNVAQHAQVDRARPTHHRRIPA